MSTADAGLPSARNAQRNRACGRTAPVDPVLSFPSSPATRWCPARSFAAFSASLTAAYPSVLVGQAKTRPAIPTPSRRDLRARSSARRRTGGQVADTRGAFRLSRATCSRRSRRSGGGHPRRPALRDDAGGARARPSRDVREAHGGHRGRRPQNVRGHPKSRRNDITAKRRWPRSSRCRAAAAAPPRASTRTEFTSGPGSGHEPGRY